jgi:hypothetical protein
MIYGQPSRRWLTFRGVADVMSRDVDLVREPERSCLAEQQSKTSMRHQVPDRVVTIGGGTGSFTMLSALKHVVWNLWAIVAMTDSGGSSRRLMNEFGHPLPLGALRRGGHLPGGARPGQPWRAHSGPIFWPGHLPRRIHSSVTTWNASSSRCGQRWQTTERQRRHHWRAQRTPLRESGVTKNIRWIDYKEEQRCVQSAAASRSW